MRSLILLLLAIIPVMVICYIVYKKDHNKEPLGLLTKLFFAGSLSCILVLIVSLILGLFLPFMNIDTDNATFIELILYAYIGVALVEEGCKLLMAYIFGYRNKEFDEKYDIIIYSIFVSCGFAAFENLLYVFGNNSYLVGIMRGVLSIPGHAFDALFMGYYLSLAKISDLKGNKQNRSKYFVKSLIIPAILHGTFDFCIFSGNTLLIIAFLGFIVALYIISIRKLNYLAKNNANIFYRANYCKNCGRKLENKFCPICGTRRE